MGVVLNNNVVLNLSDACFTSAFTSLPCIEIFRTFVWWSPQCRLEPLRLLSIE